MQNKKLSGFLQKKDEEIKLSAKLSVKALIFTWISIPGGIIIVFVLVYLPTMIRTLVSSLFKNTVMEALGIGSHEKIDIMQYMFGSIPDIVLFLLMIPFVLLILVWFVWCLMMTERFKNNSLAITNFRVIGKAGNEILDSPLNEVNNVFIEQSMWGKLLNFGSIVVSTKCKSLTFKNIDNPKMIYNELLSIAEKN